jgi:2'-5' RNA ligase
MGGMSGIRWQSDEQLHVTLRFIGEVGRVVAEDLAAGFSTIRARRFKARVVGLATFERRGKPAVLIAGVQPLDQLKALHRKLDQTCVRAGLTPEHRAYRPHLTLGRIGVNAGNLQPYFEAHGDFATTEFSVDHFDLIESDLTPKGAIYSLVQRYPLL